VVQALVPAPLSAIKVRKDNPFVVNGGPTMDKNEFNGQGRIGAVENQMRADEANSRDGAVELAVVYMGEVEAIVYFILMPGAKRLCPWTTRDSMRETHVILQWHIDCRL
jgi:hypothetical protein